MWRITCAALIGWLLACDGPLGPFPGGRLAGEEHPYPAAGFARAAGEERVAIEVGGDAPRSVHTWMVVLPEGLFVPADFFTPKRWPQLAMADPRARIRVAGRVYPCRLSRALEPGLVQRLREAVAAKYAVEPDSWAAQVEVWWFRVDPPQAPAPRS